MMIGLAMQYLCKDFCKFLDCNTPLALGRVYCLLLYEEDKKYKHIK